MVRGQRDTCCPQEMVAATARALFAKFGAWDAEALLEPQEPLSGTKPAARGRKLDPTRDFTIFYPLVMTIT